MSDELEDALADAEWTHRSAASELVGLAGAVVAAWRKHLLTGDGIKNSLFFGTAAWLGFLIALGPIDRLVALRDGELSGFVLSEPHSALAVCLLIVAFVALFWSRSVASVFGLAGVVFAAMSIRVGQWQIVQSLPYELRWIGVSLAAGVCLRGKRPIHWSTVLVGAIPAAILLLVPLRQTPRGTGYGWTLYRLDTYSHGATTNVLFGLQRTDIVAFVLIAVFALGPWLFPAGIAAALPAMTHVTLLAPGTAQIGLLLYLAGAVWLRIQFPSSRTRPWRRLTHSS